MYRTWTTLPALILVAAMLSGCTTNALKGAGIGAGAGGILGAIIGKQYGDTTKGAIIGAAVGGTAGTLIGHYMDKQVEEMQRDIEGARIERVGEGIKITFDSGILFAHDSANLQSEAQANVSKLAAILLKYEDTDILIEGHTDSDGSDDYNQRLSEQRSGSVSSRLSARGVTGARITTIGYGESAPVASNDTAAGKQQNRRVEVAVMANDDLKKAAREGREL